MKFDKLTVYNTAVLWHCCTAPH